MPKCPRCGHFIKTKNEHFQDAAARARQNYPNAFKTWNPVEDDQLRELLDNGADLMGLVKALGRQPSAIQKRLDMYGLAFKPKDGPPAQITNPPEKDYLPRENTADASIPQEDQSMDR